MTPPANAPASAVKDRPSATQAIPFREETQSAAGGAVDVLLVLTLLLASCLALLWFARKRGWLDRWIVAAPQLPGQTMRIVQMLRLSPKTTLYRVSDEQRQYLIVESLVHAQLAPFSESDVRDEP